MRDSFEAVTQAVCEIIGREDLPVRSADVDSLLGRYPVCGEIPHLRVRVVDILLHAEEGRSRLIFAVSHVLELLHVGFDIHVGVLASESRPLLAILAAALELDLFLATVANVRLFSPDQLDGQLV